MGTETVAERSLERSTFRGWPSLRMRQHGLCLHVVPSVGGRLMGISWHGNELAFVHDALAGQTPAPDSAERWQAQCVGWHFPLWGGGKTWIAPQSEWPGAEPHRDLDSGDWSVDGHWCNDVEMGVRVTSPVCRQAGLQIQRTLVMMADSTAWRIEQVLINRGKEPRRAGLWDVQMLCRPGSVTAVLQAAAGCLSATEGQPSLSALQDLGHLSLSDAGMQLRCENSVEFKCGFSADQGTMVAVVPVPGGSVRYTRRSACLAGASWAHGHQLEVFNAPVLPYFEIESHSPLKTIGPGECLKWEIHERIGLGTSP